MHKKLEIEETDQPANVLMKLLANQSISDATEASQGKPHVTKFHDMGWKISIDTPRGVIGLWSCWLGNQFFLGYPGPLAMGGSRRTGLSIAESLISRYLGVDWASPVLHVDATGVEPGYEGHYKDPEKPLEVSDSGQTVAYRTQGLRSWANFYSPRVENDLGRVWISHSDFTSYSHDFTVVRPLRADGAEDVSYGHNRRWCTHTYPFTLANHYAVDGPTTKPEHIQPYRDKFLALACALAEHHGGASAVNIDYGFVLSPEQLLGTGYENVTWLRGSPSEFKGWGNERVLASKRLDSGNCEHILLVSANEIVPWRAIRRIPVERTLSLETLLNLLTF